MTRLPESLFFCSLPQMKLYKHSVFTVGSGNSSTVIGACAVADYVVQSIPFACVNAVVEMSQKMVSHFLKMGYFVLFRLLMALPLKIYSKFGRPK